MKKNNIFSDLPGESVVRLILTTVVISLMTSYNQQLEHDMKHIR
jgi:hypothetical protein